MIDLPDGSKAGQVTRAELGQDFAFGLPQTYRRAIHKAAEKIEVEPVDILALFCHGALLRLQQKAQSRSFVHLAEMISQYIDLAAPLIDPDPTTEGLVECFFIDGTDWLKSFQFVITDNLPKRLPRERSVTVVDAVRWFVIATMARLHAGRIDELADKIVKIVVTRPNSPPDNLL